MDQREFCIIDYCFKISGECRFCTERRAVCRAHLYLIRLRQEAHSLLYVLRMANGELDSPTRQLSEWGLVSQVQFAIQCLMFALTHIPKG